MTQLAGKVAIVTGASKGIGASIAKALAGAGARVIVNYASDKLGAERVVEEIVSKDGRAIAIQADVAQSADVKRLFEQTRAAFGGLDILVNNAGVFQFDALEAVTETEFRREFDINVLGTLLSTQEAVKYFGEQGGSVINISSVVSENPPLYSTVYSATKAAVDSITRSLAKELGTRRIRVNAIAPGGVETEGVHRLGVIGSDFQRKIIEDTPLGRFGQPGDIAQVALFLASSESSWLTGERITASGGYR